MAEAVDGVLGGLILSCYAMGSRGTFWSVWAVRSPELITYHRLYKMELDMEFWERLVSVEEGGWIESAVITKLYNYLYIVLIYFKYLTNTTTYVQINSIYKYGVPCSLNKARRARGGPSFPRNLFYGQAKKFISRLQLTVCTGHARSGRMLIWYV